MGTVMEHKNDEYQLTPKAFWGMTGPQFVISAAPREFSSRYGLPIDDRDSDSLGTYVFTSKSGAVVTVYFRVNDIWSLLLKLVRPMFWRSKSAVELTVGATNAEDGLAFAQWLGKQLGVPYCRW
jgi:hypothetical protein